MACSVFGLTCHSARVSSRWTASQAPGCVFSSVQPSQKDVDWSRTQRPIPSKKDNEELPEDDRPGSPPAAGRFDGTFTVWPSNQTLADVTDTNSGVPSFSTTTSNSPYSETGLPSSPQQNVEMLPHVLVLTRLHKAHRSVQARIWDMLVRRRVIWSRQSRFARHTLGSSPTVPIFRRRFPTRFVIFPCRSGEAE